MRDKSRKRARGSDDRNAIESVPDDREYHTEWVRCDTGLLDDDGLDRLAAFDQWVWWRVFLQLARVGGFAPTWERFGRLATKATAGVEGVDPDEVSAAVYRIVEAEMFVETTRGWTVRGYTKYQRYRGQDTTAAERQRRYRKAKKADEDQEARAATAAARTRSEPEPVTDMVMGVPLRGDAKERLKAHGYDPGKAH